MKDCDSIYDLNREQEKNEKGVERKEEKILAVGDALFRMWRAAAPKLVPNTLTAEKDALTPNISAPNSDDQIS